MSQGFNKLLFVSYANSTGKMRNYYKNSFVYEVGMVGMNKWSDVTVVIYLC